jgi:hypothetical protein
MPTPCIFCDNNSGSREHLWPDWILKRHEFGPIKMLIKGNELIVKPDPDIIVKTVCGICNNGWMHKLEDANIPIIGPMTDGTPTTLDEDAQKLVAAWSVKGAMMSDSMRGRNGFKFYTSDECVNLRKSLTIPPNTLIWIGRVDGKHIANVGTDFTYNDSNGKHLSTNSVTTIAAGHFVTQAVSVHVDQVGANLNTVRVKGDDWNDKLIQIWPIHQPVVRWSPKVHITNGGPNGIAYLLDRWRLESIISAGKAQD